MIVLIEDEIAIYGLNDLLQVFLRAFACHLDRSACRHPEQRIVDVLDRRLNSVVGQFTAQLAYAAEKILQCAFGCTYEHAVARSLFVRVSFPQRLHFRCAAGA